MTWLAVACGGALGATGRYGLSQWLPHQASQGSMPWATLLANVIGSALLGLLYGLSLSGRLGSSTWQAFLGPGLCGALTTFSTFALESVVLTRAGHTGTAIAYLALNLIICLGACALALHLANGRA